MSRLARACVALLAFASLTSPAAAGTLRSRPPLEAPRPMFVTLDDAPWAGPVIVAAPATMVIDAAMAEAARADPQATLDRVFSRLAAGEPLDVMIDALLPYDIQGHSTRALASARSTWESEAHRLGRPLGADLVGLDRAGESCRRYDYIQRFPQNCLLWSFVFLRHDDRWTLTTFRLDQPSRFRDRYDAAGRGSADVEGAERRVTDFMTLLPQDRRAALTALLKNVDPEGPPLQPEAQEFIDFWVKACEQADLRHRKVEIARVQTLGTCSARFLVVEYYAEGAGDGTCTWDLFFYKGTDGWGRPRVAVQTGNEGRELLHPGLYEPVAGPEGSKGAVFRFGKP